MSDTMQAPQQAQTITIADLQNVLVLIDLASNRGTFRGAELASVGALYDRIQSFLQSVAPPVEVADAAAPDQE